MKNNFSILIVIVILNEIAGQNFLPDWLVYESNWRKPTFVKNSDESFTFSNELISRTFVFSPGFGTINIQNHDRLESLLRAVDVEGWIVLDSIKYPLGGITHNGSHAAYYNSSSADTIESSNGWNAVSWKLSKPKPLFSWQPGTRGSPKYSKWPPIGLTLTVNLQAPASAIPNHQNVVVKLNYEIYAGVPLMAKWITVELQRNVSIDVEINSIVPETLRVIQPYSRLVPSPYPPSVLQTDSISFMHVQTDQAHGTLINWIDDPDASFDPGATEPVVFTNYSSNINVIISTRNTKNATSTFNSFRTFLLITGSCDTERFGLSIRRMYRLLAPQTQENPIFFHLTNTTDDGFRVAVDQMVEVGFEMLVYSFGQSDGPAFNLENLSPSYVSSIREQVSYGRTRGMEVGGYDLTVLERGHGGYGGDVGEDWDVISPSTGLLGKDACLASGWYDQLKEYLRVYTAEVGLTMFELDGPYGGEPCAAESHAYHRGLNDSVYQQTRLQNELMIHLQNSGVYINQPDAYFFQGANKAGMGYNEFQFTLPRWEDLTISRMSVYDATYRIVPTMGWMFVPLVPYHDGPPESTFEPLSQHLAEYEMALAQYLGSGVAAAYRGQRLYDSPATRDVVKR